MKKTYKTIKMIVVLVCVVSMNALAQLSGVVTIDNTSPQTSTNFTSFASCASILNSLGVTAATTINVVANTGPYVEQVNFTQSPGISATNSIVLNGNGCTITYTSTNSLLPHTLMLSGQDYMT